MDLIRISALELACIVGLRPRERRQKQTVRIDLELGLDLSRAGRSGRITQTCDYSLVVNEVSGLLQFREYQLVEVATEELAAMLFGVHPTIDTLAIQLEKPAALSGRARTAAVRIERRRSDFPPRREATPEGFSDVLLETHEAGLYLVTIEPGKSAQVAANRPHRRAEWLVSGELSRGRSPLLASEPLLGRAPDEPLDNSSDRPATLFVCTTPPLGAH
jgi:7,8-dihydroneopterin aldolase/epimerase/oxygenase